MIEPTEQDVGRRVLYREPGSLAPPEPGVVTSVNSAFVFVRYGSEVHSKATSREALEWDT